MQIGELIRAWRKLNDVGSRELARQLGIGHATLCRIESGKDADAKTLRILANYYLAQP